MRDPILKVGKTVVLGTVLCVLAPRTRDERLRPRRCACAESSKSTSVAVLAMSNGQAVTPKGNAPRNHSLASSSCESPGVDAATERGRRKPLGTRVGVTGVESVSLIVRSECAQNRLTPRELLRSVAPGCAVGLLGAASVTREQLARPQRLGVSFDCRSCAVASDDGASLCYKVLCLRLVKFDESRALQLGKSSLPTHREHTRRGRSLPRQRAVHGRRCAHR